MYEPKIIGFLCNWCSYRGADTAGMARMKYPPNVKIIRVPCSGRISPELVLRTFREGADGVMVLGCHIGDCHYSTGNHRTAKRMPVLKKLLEYTGIEPERLYINWVSAAEGEKFATVIKEFTETDQRPAALCGGDEMTDRLTSLREAIEKILPEVDGVLALQTRAGRDCCPYLFTKEHPEELANLAIWPKEPVPDTLKIIQKAHPDAKLAIVCRGCEERGIVEMFKHAQLNLDNVTLIGLQCDARRSRVLPLRQAFHRPCQDDGW